MYLSPQRTYLRVISLHDPLLDDVRVHMHQSEEIKAHGWREAAHHHTGEYETVLVGLMMRSQVVQVQQTDLEDRGVGAVKHVGDYQRRYRLEGGVDEVSWRKLYKIGRKCVLVKCFSIVLIVLINIISILRT